MGLVLGLHGAAKAGKDTMADYLLSQGGWDAKLSFAGNLKSMCQAVFDLTDADVNTQEGKEAPFSTPKVFTQRNLGSVLYWMSQTHSSYPLIKGSKEKLASLVDTELTTPRHVLQFVGTDVCRSAIPTYHRDIVAKTIQANPDKNYIITDIRFPNEGDLVLDEIDGLVIKIVRSSDSEENIDRSHKSETAMSEWGRFTDVVNNQKDGLPFLFAEVNNLLKRQNICPEAMTQSLKPQKEDSSQMRVIDVPNGTGTTKLTSSINADSE
jgi:hypothetical protein